MRPGVGVSETLSLTGERTAPGIPSENYWFRRHVAAYRFAARIVTGTVLDAGCGEGYGSAILSRRAHRVVSLDLDRPTLTHARQRYRSPSFVRGDVSDLPLADSSVDAVVALQVIEHLADARGFLREARRTLRPGGPLVLTTPNRATFPGGLNPFHVHEYDAAELKELLGNAFDDVRMMGLAHGLGVRWLERAIAEPIQQRLIRTPYPELPPALRVMLRAVSPKSFRVVPEAEGSLDLVAVCRSSKP
ncbi:MAG: class I SAM-dependent methyltransferase [Actinomycetota bacterium]